MPERETISATERRLSGELYLTEKALAEALRERVEVDKRSVALNAENGSLRAEVVALRSEAAWWRRWLWAFAWGRR